MLRRSRVSVHPPVRHRRDVRCASSPSSASEPWQLVDGRCFAWAPTTLATQRDLTRSIEITAVPSGVESQIIIKRLVHGAAGHCTRQYTCLDLLTWLVERRGSPSPSPTSSAKLGPDRRRRSTTASLSLTTLLREAQRAEDHLEGPRGPLGRERATRGVPRCTPLCGIGATCGV